MRTREGYKRRREHQHPRIYCGICGIYLGSFRPVAYIDPESGRYFCTKEHLELYQDSRGLNIDPRLLREALRLSDCELFVYVDGKNYALELHDFPSVDIKVDGISRTGPFRELIGCGPHQASNSLGEMVSFFVP